MREMVLNHTSLRHPNRHTAVEWLTGMATGMLELHKNGVVETTLRMSQMPDWPLFDVCQALPQDKCVFIMDLFDKSRPLSDVDEDINGCEVVVAGCKAKKLSAEDSVPLKFCANTNAIAVGFPSGIWDCDRITVNGETPNTIDNLTRSVHAQTISERHRAALPQPKNFAELWETREVRFPYLKFGLDVERQLAKLDNAVLQTVIKCLERLNDSAHEWCVEGGEISWRCEVKNEGETVRKSKKKWRPKRTSGLITVYARISYCIPDAAITAFTFVPNQAHARW